MLHIVNTRLNTRTQLWLDVKKNLVKPGEVCSLQYFRFFKID